MEKGQSVDAVTLRDYFARDAELTNIGGIDFLARLASSVVSVGSENPAYVRCGNGW